MPQTNVANRKRVAPTVAQDTPLAQPQVKTYANDVPEWIENFTIAQFKEEMKVKTFGIYPSSDGYGALMLGDNDTILGPVSSNWTEDMKQDELIVSSFTGNDGFTTYMLRLRGTGGIKARTLLATY